MMEDIFFIKLTASPLSDQTSQTILNGDSRDTSHTINSLSVDHVFTSPPYLNNFDYADRTRLEMYFFGEAQNWSDITKTVRSKLITSATTQISRSDLKYILSDKIRDASPEVYAFLNQSIFRLGELRKQKGGKKSYDHLVSGYFNDMFLVLADVYRVLKNGKVAVFVLGDSAPYGVHIPTDEMLGKLGCSIGFKRFEIQLLRTRGGKWSGNTQRHHVGLRETILTLYK
ncbi:MAG: hypothetical protein KF763_10220 [Cyclobacteriaceae bacterium]|nr:hypothetical protein [Cyclobacteriaceae bacterium]